jgi:hypothetical protein
MRKLKDFTYKKILDTLKATKPQNVLKSILNEDSQDKESSQDEEESCESERGEEGSHGLLGLEGRRRRRHPSGNLDSQRRSRRTDCWLPKKK